MATDGSKGSRLAAETAIELSRKLDSELHVVYVEPALEKHTTSGLMRHRVDLQAEVVKRVEQDAEVRLEDSQGIQHRPSVPLTLAGKSGMRPAQGRLRVQVRRSCLQPVRGARSVTTR